MGFEDLKQGYRNLQELGEKALDAVRDERFEELQSLLTARQNILRQQDVRLSVARLSAEQRIELQSLARSAQALEVELHGRLRGWLDGCQETLGVIRAAREFLVADAPPSQSVLLDQTC
jgi:uncharacterized protein (DUF849 family)